MDGLIEETKANAVAAKQKQQNQDESFANDAIKRMLAVITDAVKQNQTSAILARFDYRDDTAIKAIAKHFTVEAVEEESYMTNNIVVQYWNVSW